MARLEGVPTRVSHFPRPMARCAGPWRVSLRSYRSAPISSVDLGLHQARAPSPPRSRAGTSGRARRPSACPSRSRRHGHALAVGHSWCLLRRILGRTRRSYGGPDGRPAQRPPGAGTSTPSLGTRPRVALPIRRERASPLRTPRAAGLPSVDFRGGKPVPARPRSRMLIRRRAVRAQRGTRTAPAQRGIGPRESGDTRVGTARARHPPGCAPAPTCPRLPGGRAGARSKAAGLGRPGGVRQTA